MKFDSAIEKRQTELVEKTQQLIQIDSEKAQAQAGQPFGSGVAAALQMMLEQGAALGFRAVNGDNYYGYLEFGEGQEMLGILAHVDVVPAGEDWLYPAYGAEIHAGKMYGRGTQDDKGPAMSALYAMQAVQESGVALRRRVRLILGCDEESGWECMEHYAKKEEIPTLSFTPDADYPVIFAEKGIYNFAVRGTAQGGSEKLQILAVQGGSRVNVVPNSCRAQLRVAADCLGQVQQTLRQMTQGQEVHFTCDEASGSLEIVAKGLGAHGMVPQKGINAIAVMLKLLTELCAKFDSSYPFLDFYQAKIGSETDGASLGLARQDAVCGDLTFNVGVLDWQAEHFQFNVNLRYPGNLNFAELHQILAQAVSAGGYQCLELDHQLPLYVPQDSALIQTLLKVYRDYTGDMSEPLAIGGGTYARAFPNSVAFGALLPHEEELAHQPNECVDLSTLVLNAKIMAAAIYELAK